MFKSSLKSEQKLRAEIVLWEAMFRKLSAQLKPGEPWTPEMEEIANEIDFNKAELGEEN